jgi:hypothetical protein
MTYRWLMIPVLALATAAHAATPTRPALMFLGTAHLGNHNKDITNVQVEDVLTPRRQAEMARFVDQLAAWKPTHIAVELPPSKQAELDAHYAAYRKGAYQLSADEDEQIGFRLAAKLRLPRVDAIAWNGSPPGNGDDYDWMAWARANGKSAQMDRTVQQWKDQTARQTAFLKDHTIQQWYLMWNTPAVMHENEATYFDVATFGTDDNNPGAAWVGSWYARNLRIFNHLRELAARPTDRVLVIFGAGHGPYIQKDATESGIFELADTYGYLKAMHP